MRFIIALSAAVAGCLAAWATEDVVLSNRCGRVGISLVGAQVLSYVPAGSGDVLFRPADMDFTKDRFMHGGIPVCWPWFSRCGEPGSQMHGLVRRVRWQVAELTNGVTASRAVLTVASSEWTREIWPHDFKLRYTVELGERLELKLLAENTDVRPFKVTAGFHPYFRVADPAQMTVRGLAEPVKVFPGLDKGFPTRSGGRYTFNAGMAEVEIAAQGECRLIVWNPGADWKDWSPTCNLAHDDWRRFVCVEPTVTKQENAVEMKPGDRHELSMSIASSPRPQRTTFVNPLDLDYRLRPETNPCFRETSAEIHSPDADGFGIAAK